MLKLITLVLGLAVGFGGGIYYAHQNPQEAAALDVQQQKWIEQGKQQANDWFKTKLETMIKDQSAPVTPKNATGFSSFGAGSGSTTSAVSTDALKALKAEIEAKAADPKK